MAVVRDALVALVALEHLWFLVLESFRWTKPIGLRTFRPTGERARATAALAANQGGSHGFLAAGLAWSLVAAPALRGPLTVFFLACVIVAGIAPGRRRSPGGSWWCRPCPPPSRSWRISFLDDFVQIPLDWMG